MRVHWLYKLIVLSVVTALLLMLIWLEIDVRNGVTNVDKYGPLFLGTLIGYWCGWFEKDS